MNYRLNTRMLTFVALLVVAVAALFVYTLVSAPTQEEVLREEQTPVLVDEEQRLLTAKHQYVDGIHTIAGTVDLPTPCHTLLAEAFFVGEDDATVEVRFSTALEGDACAAVVTPVPFRVSFEAPEEASIQAVWNGSPARLNLVPLQEGESLEDDLYIKG